MNGKLYSDIGKAKFFDSRYITRYEFLLPVGSIAFIFGTLNMYLLTSLSNTIVVRKFNNDNGDNDTHTVITSDVNSRIVTITNNTEGGNVRVAGMIISS